MVLDADRVVEQRRKALQREARVGVRCRSSTVWSAPAFTAGASLPAAHVALGGAGAVGPARCPFRRVRVGRAAGRRSRARLDGVAHAGSRAADGRRGREGVIRAAGRRSRNRFSAGSQAPAEARQLGGRRLEVVGGAGRGRTVQVSARSQAPLVSRQTAPLGLNSLAGQAADVPEQFSAGSQAPAEARHSVVAGLKPLAGQDADAPSQVSARSQDPLASRQMEPLGLMASAGQAADVPEQFSAASQAPAEARHSAVAGLKPSAGHEADAPLQVSARSQVPLASRQTAPLGLTASAGRRPTYRSSSPRRHILRGPRRGRRSTTKRERSWGTHRTNAAGLRHVAGAVRIAADRAARLLRIGAGRRRAGAGFGASRTRRRTRGIRGRGRSTSAGHAADEPLHLSATSQCLPPIAQTVTSPELSLRQTARERCTSQRRSHVPPLRQTVDDEASSPPATGRRPVQLLSDVARAGGRAADGCCSIRVCRCPASPSGCRRRSRRCRRCSSDAVDAVVARALARRRAWTPLPLPVASAGTPSTESRTKKASSAQPR